MEKLIIILGLLITTITLQAQVVETYNAIDVYSMSEEYPFLYTLNTPVVVDVDSYNNATISYNEGTDTYKLAGVKGVYLPDYPIGKAYKYQYIMNGKERVYVYIGVNFIEIDRVREFYIFYNKP